MPRTNTSTSRLWALWLSHKGQTDRQRARRRRRPIQSLLCSQQVMNGSNSRSDHPYPPPPFPPRSNHPHTQMFSVCGPRMRGWKNQQHRLKLNKSTTHGARIFDDYPSGQFWCVSKQTKNKAHSFESGGWEPNTIYICRCSQSMARGIIITNSKTIPAKFGNFALQFNNIICTF